jgi:NAD(P)-dependent dehydrogenase (short-subunit alcohol dehydrogenase family)
MKQVVITGASKGVGYATALSFARRGHRVLALARGEEGLRKLEEAAAELQGEVMIHTGDLLEFDAHWVTSVFAEVDILINNAGYLVNKEFRDITEEDLQRSYQVNVFAPYRIVQSLLNHFADDAHIINIGSVGGVNGTQKFPGLSAYSSSKAALSCLSECWQAEFADTGWSFNSLALGSVQTEMLAQAFPGYEAQTSAGDMGEYIARFALESGKLIKGKTQLVSNSTP